MSALYTAEIAPGESTFERKCFLRKPLRLAKTGHMPPELDAWVAAYAAA